jgi:hypothetical protein
MNERETLIFLLSLAKKNEKRRGSRARAPLGRNTTNAKTKGQLFYQCGQYKRFFLLQSLSEREREEGENE